MNWKRFLDTDIKFWPFRTIREVLIWVIISFVITLLLWKC